MPSLMELLKKYLSDAAPGGSLNPEIQPGKWVKNAVNSANARAGRFNELTSRGAQEFKESGQLGQGPANEELANILAEAYNPAGIMVGPSSPLWRGTDAFKAAQLVRGGKSPSEVWQKTQTYQEPFSKQLRQEIDDSLANFRVISPSEYGPQGYVTKPLDEVFSHPTLYDAYPELRSIRFRQGEDLPGVRAGIFAPNDLRMYQEGLKNSPTDSALHELQHSIQGIEHWPGGTSPQQQERELQVYIMNQLVGRGLPPGEALNKAMQLDLKDLAHNAYRASPGEAEAEMVVKRARMTPQRRVDSIPLDSYPIPIRDVGVFSYADGGLVKGPEFDTFMDRLAKQPLVQYAKGGTVEFKDPYAAERKGPNELTKQYPKFSGFLQGLLGMAPDEVGGGSVLDPDDRRSRELQALGAKYGFPVGTLLQMLPFGGGVVAGKAPAMGGKLAQKGVIKAPGGNWLKGSVEDSLKGLKSPYGAEVPISEMVPGGQDMRQRMMNDWIDKQLTRYVKNEMASPEDPIRLMADAWPAQRDARLAVKQKAIAKLQAKKAASDPRAAPMIDRDIGRIQAEMEEIAGYNPLHFEPDWVPEASIARGHAMAVNKGENVSIAGKSDLARDWEDLADTTIQGNPASTWLENASASTLDKNPWIAKIPPESLVYERTNPGMNPSLGFNHLIDELRNAMNSESGLPADLLLKYSSLPQVSVPQAVERVAKINAWRAAQKAEADMLRANNAATVLHKDYPEKGLKWVELKGQDPDTFEKSIEGLSPPEWEAAITKFRAGRESTLKDALKYEGEVMGHCVGGYCPDVLEGRSRIFSLRDSKGQPHVTIETAPPNWARIDQRKLSPYLKKWEKEGKGYLSLQDYVKGEYPEKYAQLMPPEESIVQIKGKGNKAPVEDYLPAVQDFVKSGQWSDVGDLQNTGLRRATDAWNVNEEKRIREAGIEFPGFLSQSEIDDINRRVWPGSSGYGIREPGYADGGIVSTPDYNSAKIDTLVSQLQKELYAE